MKKSIAALLLLTLPLLAIQAADEKPAAGPTKAMAVIHATKGNKVSGTVSFLQMDGFVQINGILTGLKPGKHGFHIHEFGDESSPDGAAAGGHFNPGKKPHGGPNSEEHHAGDLGNIVADKNGKANIEIKAKGLSLSGPHSIIGRGLVVHVGEDDLHSQPAGNAGGRAGVGVIGIAK